ncbi:mediator of RNA polymerase II transcription subunit 28 [Centruroides vittatus]|uniref:mediator of RNA polymerase II transcription subunit 28 n=1 Tax=Centruroides vittatus TaxID=120091 RepID=UPI00350ED1F9
MEEWWLDDDVTQKKSNMSSPTNSQIVDEFEYSFQACLAALTNPDYFNLRDSEEIKTGVEQTIQRFLDLARQMECFFLQRRLLLSIQKPEHIILEDTNELKNELARKEQLLQKYYDKIQYWQSLLSDTSGIAARPTQMPPPHTQSMQSTQPQMQGIPTPVSAPQPMMQNIMPSHCQAPPPNQGGMNQPPPAMVPPHPPQMHPQHMVPGQTQGNLQGPLAYLERTMSNIGMPDGSAR